MAGGFVACSRVSVALGGSLTGGLGGGDELGVLLGRTVVSLRISVPRMGVTSDCMRRVQRSGPHQPVDATLDFLLSLFSAAFITCEKFSISPVDCKA